MTEETYTEEDRKKETEMFNTCCGSCVHFQSLMGEAGICDLNPNNCLCKNPKPMIDMWNDKCEKWVGMDELQKYEIELCGQDIEDIRQIRNYFGRHDKSVFEHKCYAVLDGLIKKIAR